MNEYAEEKKRNKNLKYFWVDCHIELYARDRDHVKEIIKNRYKDVEIDLIVDSLG